MLCCCKHVDFTATVEADYCSTQIHFLKLETHFDGVSNNYGCRDQILEAEHRLVLSYNNYITIRSLIYRTFLDRTTCSLLNAEDVEILYGG